MRISVFVIVVNKNIIRTTRRTRKKRINIEIIDFQTRNTHNDLSISNSILYVLSYSGKPNYMRMLLNSSSDQFCLTLEVCWKTSRYDSNK